MFCGIFRRGSSLEKYLQAVRWLHDFCERPLGGLVDRSVAQVVRGAKKITKPLTKPFTWLSFEQIGKVVGVAKGQQEFDSALGYILATNFMLRCKDELIPLSWDKLDQHSRLAFYKREDGRWVAELQLKSRKNLPQGSVLRRACICKDSANGEAVLCPVHALINHRRKGNTTGRLFNFSYDTFLRKMRAHLVAIGLDGTKYGSKAFRRGAAMSLMKDKHCRLREVLEAGQWKSGAFLAYLERDEVDETALFEKLTADSDDEDAHSGAAPSAKRTKRADTSQASLEAFLVKKV